ncbi:CD164 sialomucin-like 2 protein isoform X2 [Pleurodeles waltl]|uniref:CD164 sialomucin-like 2 protein isoform X2 n=1 Tax=Pleurodeles waltl TaxID=8319 RepID=UPI003709BAB3
MPLRVGPPLCVSVALLFLLAVGSASSVTVEECKRFESCERCLVGEPERNITGCRWLHCEQENSTCVPSRETETVKEGCFVDSDTEMCKDSHTHSEDSETLNKEPTPALPLTGNPENPPPVFSVTSFMGGIILVLIVQAILFFTLRFIKAKDSTYQTLEDQPQ